MSRVLFAMLVSFVVISCTKPMPTVDLSKVPAGMMNRCKQKGAIILSDERYEDYWARNYDNYKVKLLNQMGTTGKMTIPDPIRRRVIRVFSKEGARLVSKFSVVHYQELTPPVEVKGWTKDGREKPMGVEVLSTTPLADWPCRSGYPRATTFHVGPVNPGDTLQITYPLSGPEQELWKFADENFCTVKSKAVFGHPNDTGVIRLNMEALMYDSTNSLKQVSKPHEFPVEYEISKALPALPPRRIPFVIRSHRCKGWDYLRGSVFHMPIWMSRDGDLPKAEKTSGGVPAELLTKAPSDQLVARIDQVGKWMGTLAVKQVPGSYWMRWLPKEPAVQVARSATGSAGGIAALVFRVLEEGGLEPRFALIHTDKTAPFVEQFVSPVIFDTLGVVVAGNDGVDRWLVPGFPYDENTPVPKGLIHEHALVMKRWVAERIKGGGSCWPEFDMLYSCFNASKALKTMDLVTIGDDGKNK